MHLTGGYAVKLTSKQNSSSPISKSSLESVIFINPFSGGKKKDVLERLDCLMKVFCHLYVFHFAYHKQKPCYIRKGILLIRVR